MLRLGLTQECLDAAEGKLPEAPVLPNGRRGKKPIRIPILKNAFLEKWFAQAHPITPGIWFGPFIALGLYYGGRDFGGWVIPLFLAGVLITTLVEYVLHRFVFHMVPKTESQRIQHFLLHGYHHDFPNDPMRLVLPPLGIWPVAALFALVYHFVFGAYFWPLYAGTAAGYVAYDWMHYYTHHFNPKGGVGRWLKRYHMLHHHDSPDHRYGITSPLWDVVFGTYLPTSKLVRRAGKHSVAEQSQDESAVQAPQSVSAPS